MPSEILTTWYLEQTESAQLRASPVPADAPPIQLIAPAQPQLNRALYAAVGADWRWTDRLPWPPERWQAQIGRAEIHTLLMGTPAAPAGYVELEQQTDGNVEIAYFGLLSQALGRGWGGHLLSTGLRTAWSLPGTRRVWVHTCSWDAPAALANYRARGMRLYKEEVKTVERRSGSLRTATGSSSGGGGGT